LSLIVDTSVAVKWYIQELNRDRAMRLLDGQDLAAPDLILFEAANVVARKVRLGEVDRVQAALILPHLRAGLTLLPSVPMADEALAVAVELRHAVYDCFFLVAAERLDGALVTADEKLAKRCRDTRFETRVRLL
jgi:predicted nucleic acid-binding protein